MEKLMWLAIGITAVIFCYLFGVTFCPIPQTGLDHSKTIVPFLLGTGLGTVIGFYFGNSKKQTEQKGE